MDINIKRSDGVMTIEASISFTIFLFVIVFILAFGKLYIAQNMVNHATLQTARNLSVQSVYDNKVSETYVGSVLEGKKRFEKYVKLLFSQGEYPSKNQMNEMEHQEDVVSVKSEFQHVLTANSTFDADSYLRWAGVEHGISDIKFDDSVIGDDIVIKASYKVRFNFPFIGKKYLKMYQAAKVKCLR